MTDGEPTFVTPAEACDLLESFWSVTERTLEDWRRRHALPGLVRQPLGPGCGPGAVYGWTDPVILVQVAMLKSAKDTRGRLQWMKLAAWFAGFDYPLDEMRGAWTWLCRRTGVDAIAAQVGWPSIENGQMPEAVQTFYDHLVPQRQKTPATLEFLLAKLDPAFKGPSRDALDDARQLWLDESNVEIPEMLAELLVRGGFDVQRVFGSASVEAALAEVDADQFALAHRDARVFLDPLRLMAARMIESGEGAAQTLLYVLPKLGHQLHKTALLLRLHGYGNRIDTTIAHLQVFWSTPVVQEAFWEAVNQLRAKWMAARDEAGPISRPSPEDMARFAEYWENPELRAAFNTAWRGVRDAWADLVGPLVEEFFAALDADLSPGADHASELV